MYVCMCVCLCVCVCVCVFIIIILIIIVTITQAKVEEMRYAGPSTFGSRRIVDEYDAKLSEANAKCDKNRKRFDKMAKLLVNAKAGIQVIFFFVIVTVMGMTRDGRAACQRQGRHLSK